jgi:aerobic carbon-monoxide dehydrogenase medium subunit
VKPPPFVYHRPESLQDALKILHDVAPEDGRIIAGGQSLVPMMAYRIATPGHLVDINRIPELANLKISDDSISVFAAVRHAAFETIETPGPTGALLRHVAHHVAHHPIRVRGTFCGSLAHADPASEWCLVVTALDATLIAGSVTGSREIPASEYFNGVMTTVLEPDEILIEARLPVLAADTRCSFIEFSRRAGDFAIASVLVTGRLANGVMRDARIGIGGAEASPRRFREVEGLIEGNAPSPDCLREAAEAVAESLEPLEDTVNTADYRRDLVRALTRRALQQSFAMPVDGGV